MSSVGSATLCSKKVRFVRRGRAFISLNECMLLAANALLPSTQKSFQVTGLGVSFWGADVSSEFNGMLNSNGLNEMLEGKDYHSVHIGFPFTCVFWT